MHEVVTMELKCEKVTHDIMIEETQSLTAVTMKESFSSQQRGCISF